MTWRSTGVRENAGPNTICVGGAEVPSRFALMAAIVGDATGKNLTPLIAISRRFKQ